MKQEQLKKIIKDIDYEIEMYMRILSEKKTTKELAEKELERLLKEE